MRMPQALLAPESSRNRAPKQDQVSEVTTALHVPSKSNNLSLISKITSKDPSSDVKAIKRKQSDISQQEEIVSKRKRVRSPDSVQNHQRSPSPQQTELLNKDLNHMLSYTSAHNVPKPVSFSVDMYDASGSQAKSGSQRSVSNKPSSSSDDQCLMEKDSTSPKSPESLMDFRL